MREAPSVVLIGTLDTKGPEIEYTREKIRAFGGKPLIVDSGILGEPNGCLPDISRTQVAEAAGQTIEALRAARSRGAAIEQMERGVREIFLSLWSEGRLDGVLCLGGFEGALLGAAGMKALPVGVPKLIVSPTASGRRNFGPLIGETDTCVMHSVVDILGLNPIARAVFDNAAASVVGMARHAGRPVVDIGSKCIGITMLGQTTPGVMHVRDRLEQEGYETVIFHANGVGGPAMEKLVADGAFAGVLDYTLSEVANSIRNGHHTTGPERLCVVGFNGIPQVVVPGCVDFFNQGPRDTLPAEYRARKSYFHNPVATLVRLSSDEMAKLGRTIGTRLNTATGRVWVVVPRDGFSLAGIEGEDLWDPEADLVFTEALSSTLDKERILFELVDGHANDPAFADVVADRCIAVFGDSLETLDD